MVQKTAIFSHHSRILSVLALSSRFDGPDVYAPIESEMIQLSVLALSSRFDGPGHQVVGQGAKFNFQYSLCRVVLMVLPASPLPSGCFYTFSTRSVESF